MIRMLKIKTHFLLFYYYLVLGHEEESSILIALEGCNINRQQKISRTTQLFLSHLYQGAWSSNWKWMLEQTLLTGYWTPE